MANVFFSKILKNIKHILKKIKKYKMQIGILVLLIFLIACGYLYYTKFFYMMKDAHKLKRYILSYGKYSVLAFFAMQVIQVVAFFIPGEIVQIAGGYIFGTVEGSIISAIGITIGSIAAFFVARLLGKAFVDRIISEGKVAGIRKFLKSEKANYAIFLIYLIPGLPKDILAYLCGVSEVRAKSFIIYSTVGRLPGIITSAYFGNKLTKGDLVVPIVIAVVMSILFIVGAIKGEKIIKKMIEKKHKG
ncbi:TVP38/TMEM64 family protein [Clostridium hydrogenum]|uniref:TVP38/TMEM64 family protein n=1 Tax=Clostridium hydrogenum TaxID=2855764 RepID=UPI001F35469D|nr:TVP38/TMEM64 family protein [Clostridium hydrogenum]